MERAECATIRSVQSPLRPKLVLRRDQASAPTAMSRMTPSVICSDSGLSAASTKPLPMTAMNSVPQGFLGLPGGRDRLDEVPVAQDRHVVGQLQHLAQEVRNEHDRGTARGQLPDDRVQRVCFRRTCQELTLADATTETEKQSRQLSGMPDRPGPAHGTRQLSGFLSP
jgi:hypothetical protein